MIRTTRFMAFPAAALLVASAGLAQPAGQPGQPGMEDRDWEQDRRHLERDPLLGERPGADAQRPWGTVARGGNVIGATVLDVNNENVGSINDLIIDPRSGHVVYVILAHGGFLGIGAEHVAIPWQELETRPDLDRTYQVNITQERLEQAPSFEEDAWPLLTRPGWFDTTDEFFGTTARQDRHWGTGGWGMQGRIQQEWQQGQHVNITGTLTSIDEDAPAEGMSEGVVVTIQGQDGEEHTVHLGPAWYIEGQLSELREDQHVEVQGRQVMIDDQELVMAQTVRLEEGTLALRDQQGQPAWDAAQHDQQRIFAVPEERDFDERDEQIEDPKRDRHDDPHRDPHHDPHHDPHQQPDRPGMRDPQQRDPGMHDPRMKDRQAGAIEVRAFVRGSEVRGSNVRSWEEENVGTVNELAIDTNTGRIPFVVAGFGGFLGIGEEEVVLPWQALSFLVHEDRFMLAVDKQLLRTAPRLARDDVARLEDHAFRQEVYSHYGMDPAFATYEHQPTPELQEREPWGANGELQELFAEGQRVDLEGKVVNVGRGEIMPGTAEAVFINLRDQEGQEHMVKLGPAWFLQRQDLMVRPGEQIAIQGRQIEIEGRTMVLASTAQTAHAGLRLRDQEGRPRWDAFEQERHLGIEEPRDLDDPQDPGMHDPEEPDWPHDPAEPDTPAQPGGY